MNKKTFSASSWLIKKQAMQSEEHYSEGTNGTSGQYASYNLASRDIISENQPMNRYFVPGWKGESLTSKEVKKFNKILDALTKDSKKNLFTRALLSRKLQDSIYNEFLSFAEYKAINCTKIENNAQFWQEIQSENSDYKKDLERFIDVFSFRVAVIFLLKVRFIVTLQEETSTDCHIKDIYYPNSFLAKVFKSASTLEMKSKAFDSNVFSWYRPSESLKNQLLDFKEICSNLKITDIIKNISTRSEILLEEKAFYSHSISHKNYGLFLNSLLINFPIWLKSQENGNRQNFMNTDKIEAISCKFTGDYLESMALSHWLAQEQNQNLKWDQILCPDFKRLNFESGLYLRTLNELQFLTFLAQIAKKQNCEPKKFVAKVINSNHSNRKNSNNNQRSLLLNADCETSSTYNRVILNLNEFPKSNPQHFLFNKILKQKDSLKDDGLLYVQTSKKLFVTSQKAKIDSLLKEFKIEGIFNLDDVKGKGEVASYIYIFSKVKAFAPIYENQEKKKPCFNFRLSAKLDSFQYFNKLTTFTHDFLQNNKSDIPPLYSKQDGDFKFEFYQDAIVDGLLIHSSSKDSSKVTHPLFFKNLMDLCNPLDYFFEIQIKTFGTESYQKEEPIFAYSTSFQRDEAPLTIIVDQRVRNSSRIEIINTNQLEAKAYEYGHSMCFYFSAYPKWPSLSVNAIKDYFNSRIGQQLIDLTFNNEHRKIKGNLSKLLIPRFFIGEHTMPEHITQGLSLFAQTSEELISTHPTELEAKFSQIESLIHNLVRDYPGETLAYLSHFRKTVTKTLETIESNNKKLALNFNNPIIKSPLMLSKTTAIYPDNNDVFIEFNSEVLELIHQPLQKYKRNSEIKNNFQTHTLELYHQDIKVLTLYSDEDMILFVEFLLSQAQGYPISKLLQGIKVPAINDLKAILTAYKSMSRTITALNEKLPTIFDNLINLVIVKNR